MASDGRAPFSIDAKAVRLLAKILNETNLSEIEYELERGRIRVVRHSYEPTAHTAPMVSGPVSQQVQQVSIEPVVSSKEDDFSKHPGAVKSPMVGVAYLSPQPDASPFVSVGDQVEEGQTLLILEAMKVMNPIRAPKAGTVHKIFTKNGQAIEYGELLMVIN